MDRVARGQLAALQAYVGTQKIPEVKALLTDDRWYVLRNMMLLLRAVHDRTAVSIPIRPSVS